MADRTTLALFGGLFALLSLASLVGRALRRRAVDERSQKVMENLNERIYAWWLMVAVFGVAVAAGPTTSFVLFALVSFLALREFLTLTPTRPGDHRSLFAAFFVLLPLNYLFLAIGQYGVFIVFIPVWAFLFVPIRNAVSGDHECYLERTAKIQWGLMVCVFFVSHAPALLLLKIPGHEGAGARLLFFLVFVVQISDVLQYVWGKLCGKHPIAPKLSPNKTVEGFVGGALSAAALGGALWWMTPFTWWQTTLLALACVIMGFFGGLVMSAIKRDRGVKDYGELLPGHGGMMDRIDSLCFSAPVFFHLIRFFFT
jgi:phosphatidate cytidylyltransferase